MAGIHVSDPRLLGGHTDLGTRTVVALFETAGAVFTVTLAVFCLIVTGRTMRRPYHDELLVVPRFYDGTRLLLTVPEAAYTSSVIAVT